MSEWLPYGMVFAGVSCLVLALLSLFRRRPQPDRLRRLDEEPEEKPALVLGPLTTALSEQLPITQKGKVELQEDLRIAGFYRPTALLEYRAVRAALVIVATLATCLTALAVDRSQVGNALTYGALAILLAFSVPRVYLFLRGRTRARQIERGLPLAIDLLILCLSAGQNLLAALKQVAKQLYTSNPVLAQELTITQQQAELHSLGYAMRQWADRVHVPDVRNLALLLIQSEKLGTDAASTLQELANNFRTTARQRAEAQANRTSFWLLLPSVFCFWVASAIILLGPAYLEFFQFRTQTKEYMEQNRPNIEQANRRNLPGNAPADQAGQPAQPAAPAQPARPANAKK